MTAWETWFSLAISSSVDACRCRSWAISLAISGSVCCNNDINDSSHLDPEKFVRLFSGRAEGPPFEHAMLLRNLSILNQFDVRGTLSCPRLWWRRAILSAAPTSDQNAHDTKLSP